MDFGRSVLLVAAAIFAAPVLSLAGPLCGPGDHWVDNCPGGLYTFNSVSTVSVELDLDSDGSFEYYVPFLQLSGTTSVFLGPGSPHTIPTELVSILESGSGVTLRAGDGIGNLDWDGSLHSPGYIEEQAGNTFLANSFFDVFFEIEVGPLTLRNFDPLKVACYGLTQAPPQICKYEIIGDLPLNLYDQSETVRGRLWSTPDDYSHHQVTPTPEPAGWITLSLGLAAVAVLRRRSQFALAGRRT